MRVMTAIRQPRFLLAIALCAILLLRALVPAGWMPSDAKGQWITVCSGAGVSMAFVGADGKIHKDKAPGTAEKGGHCAFSGLGLTLDVPAPTPIIQPAEFSAIILPMLAASVAIGQGLAAPPPPKTGPPALN